MTGSLYETLNKIETCCVDKAGLELKEVCLFLFLPSAGIKGMHHCTQLKSK